MDDDGWALLSHEVDGHARAGLLVRGRVRDLAQATGRPAYARLEAVLEDWPGAEALCESAARTVSAQDPALETLRLRAPWLPGTIYCAGANFQDHIEEMARAMQQPVGPNAKQLGENPWHFVKPARSTVVGPGACVALPGFSSRIDHEIELAAVIGRAAREVPAERALEHVAGYTIANDLSAREVGRARTPVGSPFHYDWITMKGFEGACPLGPWIVPARRISDPQALPMKLWVNDELRQDSHTGHMIFSLAEQIAWLSTRLTLQPGDLILTGTPAGVGMPQGRFLQPGDRLRLWIGGIGELAHSVGR